MSLPSFSLKRRVTTFMIYVAVVLFGAVSIYNLPIDLMPSVEVPVALIQVSYPGATPLEVENMITRPLEQVAARVSGIEEITSNSSQGMSNITIMFAFNSNIDNAISDLKDKVDQIKDFLPKDASAPIVAAIDPDSIPVIVLGVSGDKGIPELQDIADNIISPQLERVPNVASVSLSGGYSTRIVVETYADKLRGYGITPDYIAQVLRAENIAISSGTVNNGSQVLSVTTSGEFKTIEDIQNYLIPLPQGGSIILSEISDIKYEPEDMSTISKFNGNPTVSLSIQKQSATNTVSVAGDILKTVESLRSEYPNIDINVLSNQAEFINLAINSVSANAVIGAVFAVIVLFMFLKNIRPTLVIAISIPVSIIATFILMYYSNLTLNMMTLGGLALGVGMMVDNSIVVLENIYRFYQEGYSKYDSCLKGSLEVALSISASTLTTIAVFAPISFSSGMTAIIFRELALTITMALLSSLLVALTLVPLLCFITLSKRSKAIAISETPKYSLPTKMYLGLLKTCLKFKITTVVVSVGLFALSIVVIATLGAEFFPTTDQGVISVSIQTPNGTELEATYDITNNVYDSISDIKEIDSISYDVSQKNANINIMLASMDDRKRSTFEIADEIRNIVSDIAGAKISVSNAGAMDFASLSGSAIQFDIIGDDLDTLEEISTDLVSTISGIEGAREVSSSLSQKNPSVKITVNQKNASRFALSAATIGSFVKSQLSGVSSTSIKVSGKEIDVLVKGDEISAQSVESLRSMPIQLQSGGSIPLDVVADISIELSPVSISRRNQARVSSISGNSFGVDVATLNKNVEAAIANYPLPEGYQIEVGGQSQEITDAFLELALGLILSVLLVYLVLASQFEALLIPFIIMLSIPLGLTGGLVGLFFAGLPVSVPALIGTIMLSGIVVNNAIVLIDYINTRRGMGEDRITAILNACPLRIRPVFMTTLTTILGLLPMALGFGEGNEIMAPLAIVMISGLVISTIVTLLFVPVFYLIMDSVSFKIRSVFKRGSKEKAEGEVEDYV